jgi:tRNA A-37 threonylcarbamoyl transferase component Bud32
MARARSEMNFCLLATSAALPEGCHLHFFMHEAKNTQRALVRIGYDGRVHKYFRGPDAAARFANEVRVLRKLEERGCDYVPRILEAHEDQLYMVTTNCGSRVERISESRVKELFFELERDFGVRHDDPFDRNVTYRASDGRFCLIDFEFATVLDTPAQNASA